MNVTLGSCFRNAAGEQIKRYFSQVERLAVALNSAGHHLASLILVEGDSTDNTLAKLEAASKRVRSLYRTAVWIVDRTHGGRNHGQTELVERMRNFGYAANGVFENANSNECDAVVYVESDLIWEAHTLVALVEQLAPGRDIIAAPVFCGDPLVGQHYDVWGVRAPDGTRFGPLPPYSPVIVKDGLTPLSTAGSCLAMRAEVAEACRCDDEALVGFCKHAGRLGYKVWIDWRLKVEHP